DYQTSTDFQLYPSAAKTSESAFWPKMSTLRPRRTMRLQSNQCQCLLTIWPLARERHRVGEVSVLEELVHVWYLCGSLVLAGSTQNAVAIIISVRVHGDPSWRAGDCLATAHRSATPLIWGN